MAQEESQEVAKDIPVEETGAPESTTDENNSPDVDFDAGFNEDQPVSEETTDSSDDEAIVAEDEESEAEDVESETDEKPQTRAEKRKEQLQSEIDELQKQADPQTEIRDLVARRNELKRQVEAKNADVYKPASVDDLLEQVNPETGDYYTRLEAKLEAREQADQVRAYTEQVAEAQLTLQSEAQRVVQDFPMFDEGSPEYNPTVAAQAEAILQNAIQFDQNTGQIVGSTVSPYQLYKSLAVAAQASAQKAQIQGQKATEKMLSQADVVSSASQAEKSQKKDAFLSGFENDGY